MVKKPRVLLDSSVILSALFSSTGASALILKLAKQREIEVIINDYIVEEVESVLIRKSPENIASFIELIGQDIFTKVSNPTTKEVVEAKKLISDRDDAPILATAIRERVDYLATLDRKDFLTIKLPRQRLKTKIVLPKDLVKVYQHLKSF